MNNYKSSDYAINRYSGGIVYRFADGTHAEVTLADFLSVNPDKTEDDFLALKELSDDIYREQDRAHNAQNKKNISIYGVDEALLLLESSPEEIHISEINSIEEEGLRQERLSIVDQILDKLTEIQRRRYLLHVVHELTTREIAIKEGVAQQVVNRSILSANKKIKKVLATG